MISPKRKIVIFLGQGIKFMEEGVSLNSKQYSQYKKTVKQNTNTWQNSAPLIY